MQDSQDYTVVIGDISGSKRLNGVDRYQTQLFVKSAIVQVNEEFRSTLEAPATITKGDEFQALLTSPGDAFRLIRILQKMVFPTCIRYGIGIGNIYRMGGILPIEMDGPAFHRANRALTFSKKNKTTMWLVSDRREVDQLVNTIFSLISAIKSRWNERHYKLYWAYQELGTYKQVAETENVTPQAIFDVLKNTRAIDVIDAEKNLEKAFEQYMPELVSDI
jgi:hypothetical protein